MKIDPNQPVSLLIGHGSRHAETARAGAIFTEQVARVLNQQLVLAWLDYCRPTIADVLNDLNAQGVQHINVQPLMLTAAGHVTTDIPNALTSFAGTVNIAPPLGDDALLLSLIEPFTIQSLPKLDETAQIMLIARDSHGPTYKAQAQRLAAALGKSAGITPSIGYVGVTDTHWADVIKTLPDRDLLILPLLLMRGRLWDQIAASAQNRMGNTIIMPPLCHHHLMVIKVAQQLLDLQEISGHDW